MRTLGRRILEVVLVAMPAGAAVHAQSPVTIVDATDGGLQSAIQAAADGDILIVRGGPYDAFTIDGKGLTVVADEGHSVDVYAPLVVKHLAANQTVLIRGFAKLQAGTPGGHRIFANDGPVWIESCSLTSGVVFGPIPQCLVVHTSPAVVLAGCRIAATGTLGSGAVGLVTKGSQLALFDCEIYGATGAPSSGPGTPSGDGATGLHVIDSFVHLEGCTVSGGGGGSGFGAFDPGSGTAICTDGADGGTGIALDGPGALVETVATTFVGGPGGGAKTYLGCHVGADGVPIAIVAGSLQTLPCLPHALAVTPSPAVGGSTLVTVTVGGSPGDVAAVIYGPPLFVSLAPACGMALAVPLGQHMVGVVDSAGSASFAFVPPAYAPGLGQDVYLQAVAFTPFGALELGATATLTVH